MLELRKPVLWAMGRNEKKPGVTRRLLANALAAEGRQRLDLDRVGRDSSSLKEFCLLVFAEGRLLNQDQSLGSQQKQSSCISLSSLNERLDWSRNL